MSVFDPNTATSKEKAEQIIPRAEFRVFGQGIIDIVGISMWNAQAKLFKIRQSSETYILSRHTNEANVKIRDGLLDIKTKVGETEEGYEIFQPKGKFTFPVKKRELKTIFWAGTENWDELLVERAAISGTLVLSDFTKNAINSFKAK